LSTLVVCLNMNLHEECLLKYLENPLNLFKSTEMLTVSNLMIEQEIMKKKIRGENLCAEKVNQH